MNMSTLGVCVNRVTAPFAAEAFFRSKRCRWIAVSDAVCILGRSDEKCVKTIQCNVKSATEPLFLVFTVRETPEYVHVSEKALDARSDERVAIVKPHLLFR